MFYVETLKKMKPNIKGGYHEFMNIDIKEWQPIITPALVCMQHVDAYEICYCYMIVCFDQLWLR